jgi:hypothetical protein
LADAPKRLSAAEIQFKRAQNAPEEKKALVQYEADALALNKKSERLKALRLARDAEEAAARPPAPQRKRRTKKIKQANSADEAGTLSGWWKDQREDGRNN